jgi:hypothetical protein
MDHQTVHILSQPVSSSRRFLYFSFGDHLPQPIRPIPFIRIFSWPLFPIPFVFTALKWRGCEKRKIAGWSSRLACSWPQRILLHILAGPGTIHICCLPESSPFTPTGPHPSRSSSYHSIHIPYIHYYYSQSKHTQSLAVLHPHLSFIFHFSRLSSVPPLTPDPEGLFAMCAQCPSPYIFRRFALALLRLKGRESIYDDKMIHTVARYDRCKMGGGRHDFWPILSA